MAHRPALASVIVIAAALVLGGCAAPPLRTLTTLPALGHEPRVVLMPPDVELRELTAGGVQEPQAEWTDAANRNVVAAFAAEARARNLQYVAYESGRGDAQDRALARDLIALHRVVGESVLIHQYTKSQALPTKAGVFSWSLGPAAAALARSQAADYALFIAIRDSYATKWRYAVIWTKFLLLRDLPLSIPAGAQVGYASLVDLRTGNLVWFNQLSRGSGDLRTPEAARETVRALLAGFPT